MLYNVLDDLFPVSAVLVFPFLHLNSSELMLFICCLAAEYTHRPQLLCSGCMRVHASACVCIYICVCELSFRSFSVKMVSLPHNGGANPASNTSQWKAICVRYLCGALRTWEESQVVRTPTLLHCQTKVLSIQAESVRRSPPANCL